MKKKLTFTVLALSLILFSCKKEKTEPPAPQPPDVSKKMMTTTFFGIGASFEYNPDGSLKKMVDQRNWGTYRYEFSYQPGKAFITLYNETTNQKESLEEITLNGKGYAEKTVKNQYDNNGNPYAFYTTNFYYNAQGLLEKAETPGVFKSLYYYSNGNITKQEYYNGVNDLQDYTTYEYSNMADKFPVISMTSWALINRFLPQRANKLAAKVKSFDVILNKVAWENDCSYELDKDGFVTKGTSKDVSQPGNPSYSWTNTWDK